MAKPQSAEAIAKWAEGQDTPKLHKGKGSSLTHDQLKAIVAMRGLGKTQVEIAQAIGCDQGTVSRWLHDITDTTDLAGTYLRGKALRMAQNIVKKGRAADHIKALEGINVLSPEQVSGITVQIGIKAEAVTLLAATFASPGQGQSESQ
jgi:hypothetical protein